MRVAHSDAELRAYLDRAARINSSHPVVLTQYLPDAREIELDAVARDGRIILHAVSEHVENAGTHSGDATLVLPPQWLPGEVVAEVERIGVLLANALEITGPFNMQALWDGRSVKVIECNLRASRSLPFVSKTLGRNFAREAMRVMLGAEPSASESLDFRKLQHVAVKAAQFSFGRIKGADPRSGVEMASTGEAASFGATVEDALVMALRATGLRAPKAGAGVLVWEAERTSESLVLDLQGLRGLGFELFGNRAAAEAAALDGVILNRVAGDQRHIADLLRSGAIDWVIAPATPNVKSSEDSGFLVRRLAADFGVSLVSERQLARRLVDAVVSRGTNATGPRSWQAYMGRRQSEIAPLRLFVRQPFTETSPREQAVVQRFLDMLQRLDRPDRPVRILTGTRAQSESTFRQSFERSTGRPFTPRNFRSYRLGLLRQADAMIILRTGLSESTAFELAHNIFEGPRVPVWMAIATGAPVKTTLLRDLDDLCEISYHPFDDVTLLEEPLAAFVDALWERRVAEGRVRKAS
jgi:carbamoyl-phosphate synthase large subunit